MAIVESGQTTDQILSDADASAWVVKEGTKEYIQVDTSNEKVIFGTSGVDRLTISATGQLITGTIGTYTGTGNVAIGTANTLSSVDHDGVADNIAIGASALKAANEDSGNSPHSNVAIGGLSMNALTTGNSNVAIGLNALKAVTTAGANVAIGISAGKEVKASDTVYIGKHSGHDLNATGGTKITAVGSESAKYYGSGTDSLVSLGTGCSYIGSLARASASSTGVTNETVVGYNAIGLGSNTVVLGNNSVTRSYFSRRIDIWNPTEEDSALGREGSIHFLGENSGGELHAMAKISGVHKGTDDDEGGVIQFACNSGSVGETLSGGSVRMSITDHGVAIGGSAAAQAADHGSYPLLVNGSALVQDGDATVRTNSADAVAKNFLFEKSRNATDGAHTVVANDDVLGTIEWRGSDGDSFAPAAKIFARVDGSPGDGDMPTELVFATSADGAEAPTERLNILPSGKVVLNPAVGSSLSALIIQPTDGAGCIYATTSSTTATRSIVDFKGNSGGTEVLSVYATGRVMMANLPTSNPGIAGHIYRDGSGDAATIKFSTG